MKRVDKLTRDVSTKTVRNLNNIDKGLNNLSKNAANFAKGFAVGAVTAAIGGISAMVTQAISGAAAIGDLSDKLGTTTEQLQGLQYGAVQANMDFETLSSSLMRFSKALGEAANGQGDLLKTLRANGAELKGSYFENLVQFADLVKNARNEQDQMLLITQAFGRGGTDMLEFLRDGSAGLRQFLETSKEVGANLDENLIRKAQEIDDRWAELMLSMSQRFRNMVLTNIRAFDDLKKGLNDPNAKSVFRMGIEALGGGSLFEDAVPKAKRRTQRVGGFLAQPIQPPTIPFNPEKAAAEKRAREEAAREAERQAKAIQDVIDELKLEIEQIGQSEEAQELSNRLRAAGVTLISAEGQKIAALVAKKYEEILLQDEYNEGVDKILERQEELQNSLRDMADLGVDAFESWAIEGEKLSDVLADVSKMLAKAAIQAALFGEGPLAGLAGTKEGGGLFGSLFKQAGGGTLHTGRPTLVGERGPELIVPRGAGYVVPNSGLRGGGGEGPINIKFVDNAGVSVTPKRGQGDRRELEFIIDQRIDRRVADPYTPTNLALGARGARNPVKRM
ncbi:phage tail tape measure protein [Taklimakanibacter deserti]|uniref:phage tail tape measure protein n=1 Tax=Taklimakanibacter deserti TaxID=2267839 RepID=UPI0013C4D952